MGFKPQSVQLNTLSDYEIAFWKKRFLEIAQSVCPQFRIDESNRAVIAKLFGYATKTSTELDLQKGIMLCGSIGTGKTTLLITLGRFMNQYSRGFKVVTSDEVVTEYQAYGDFVNIGTPKRETRPFEYVSRGFDELGREPIPAQYYGTKQNVMQVLLQRRYSLWQGNNEIKTHITTNCTPAELEACYGSYIRDRVREMCNYVVLDGKSRRI